jgi:hypothetical protein
MKKIEQRSYSLSLSPSLSLSLFLVSSGNEPVLNPLSPSTSSAAVISSSAGGARISKGAQSQLKNLLSMLEKNAGTMEVRKKEKRKKVCFASLLIVLYGPLFSLLYSLSRVSLSLFTFSISFSLLRVSLFLYLSSRSSSRNGNTKKENSSSRVLQ